MVWFVGVVVVIDVEAVARVVVISVDVVAVMAVVIVFIVVVGVAVPKCKMVLLLVGDYRKSCCKTYVLMFLKFLESFLYLPQPISSVASVHPSFFLEQRSRNHTFGI